MAKRRAAKRTATRKTAVTKTAARKTAARKTAARAAAARKNRTRRAPKPSRMAAAAALVRGTAEGMLSAMAAQLPWGADENDPIRLLEADHRRFEALLKQGEASTERAVKTRSRLLETLTAELNLHELLEEKVLYPALAPHGETREIVLEGYQEHHVADLILTELQGVAAGDEQWGAKFKVLKENIEHHIQEEERAMFRSARAVLGQEQLDEIGARMKGLRRQQRAG